VVLQTMLHLCNGAAKIKKTWEIRFWCLVLAIPNGETVFFHHFIGGTVLVSTFYWWNSDSSTILLVEQC
jgi:hypothetical protein